MRGLVVAKQPKQTMEPLDFSSEQIMMRIQEHLHLRFLVPRHIYLLGQEQSALLVQENLRLLLAGQ